MPITNDVEKMIQEFEGRNGDVAFTKIDRKLVATQLRDRLKVPGLVDQGNSSLCGPAVFIYCLAKRKPKVYAQYVIDLYEKGEATIGRLQVKPGMDCRNYQLPAESGMAGADWIALAGLRDSENGFLDYDSYKDQAAGITLPGDVAKWFAFGDFLAIRNKTNTVLDKDLQTLLKAHQSHACGACVCLFVGSHVLQGFAKGKSPADHWVVLESGIRIDGMPVDPLLAQGKKVNQDSSLMSKKIEFTVFSWADGSYPVNRRKPNLTVEEFLDYFYGYVAAQ